MHRILKIKKIPKISKFQVWSIVLDLAVLVLFENIIPNVHYRLCSHH